MQEINSFFAAAGNLFKPTNPLSSANAVKPPSPDLTVASWIGTFEWLFII
jgi:hypothetical protein